MSDTQEALERIVDAMNDLERLGFEPMNSDVYACALQSLPFKPNGRLLPDALPERKKWTIFYDHSVMKWALQANG